ncbi:retrovirus-related pol polyprotein from transposon TNT 1-94 [Tanacetum coccineum]
MDLYTKLPDRVLDLENVKDAQSLEIKKLKKRVKKLEHKKKSRTPQLKRRLFKGRNEIDQDEGISWCQEDSETQGRYGHDTKINTASTSITTASINITTAEPVTATSAPVTTAGVSMKSEKSKAKGVTMQKPSESGTRLRVPPPQIDPKYKGKAKMRLQAELDKEAKLEREREKEASKAANIVEWDNVQAMMDAEYELAIKLQEEEQGEISIKERSKLFVELMNERKKHFARLKVEEKRRKPLTKAQKRNQMPNYLKNMAGYTLQQFKGYSFDEIKTMFETTMRKVNTFVPIESEVDRGAPELAAGSSKRYAEEELDQESSKRQKSDESSELAEEPRDKEVDELSQEELQQMMIIVPEQGMNVEALQTKEGNRHLHAGREGVSIVKGNSYIDAGRKPLEFQDLPLPNPRLLTNLENQLIREALDFDVNKSRAKHAQLHSLLNSEQRMVYDKVIESVYSESGIASLLLLGGQTAHNKFVIPLELVENSTYGIKQNTHLAELMQQVKLVIWDEAPMTRRMRVNEYNDNGDIDTRKQDFNKWVLVVGDGRLPAKKKETEDEPTWIEISEKQSDESYLKEREILTPRNDDTDAINEFMFKKLGGASECPTCPLLEEGTPCDAHTKSKSSPRPMQWHQAHHHRALSVYYSGQDPYWLTYRGYCRHTQNRVVIDANKVAIHIEMKSESSTRPMQWH